MTVDIDMATICSGIGAPEVAARGLGLRPIWCAEIDRQPAAVLAARIGTPNLGDMTAADFVARALRIGRPRLLIAGTPCQAFSVAGRRRSLSDERGNLTLRLCEIMEGLDDGRLILLWENVPGVLNTEDNAFGCLLGQLCGESAPIEPPGGRWTNAGVVAGPVRTAAWRVLDAQYFGLAQRRRRVFVVASADPGISPAEILFEFEGGRRDSAPGGEAGEGIAATLTRGADSGGDGGYAGRRREDDVNLAVVPALTASGRGTSRCGESRGQDPLVVSGAVTAKWAKGGGPAGNEAYNLVTHALTSEGADASEDGTGRGTPLVAEAVGVRRLMPIECERLQGFPDDWTLIEDGGRPMTDSPRYRMIGNSMAVKCIRWVLARIAGKIEKHDEAERSSEL